MSAARVRAIVFDLDGTLVDSRLDLAEAVNRARGELGLEPLADEAIVGMVGAGARNLVRRALGGEPDEALLDRALEHFYRHYDAVCLDRTRPYPGIDELIRALPADLPLAVLSNKPERFVRRIVEHLGWGARFEVVAGGDTWPTRKPEPHGLLDVARRLGVAPADVLLVGDSRIDAATAEAAGTGFLFVEWGFARAEERERLSRGGAASTASDVLSALRARGPLATAPPPSGSA